MVKIYSSFCLMFIALALSAQTEIVVKDSDVGAGLTEWTSDNVYILDGYVFVEDGATLTIEAGTVIKGEATPSTGDVTSALIVARGARIEAVGTADAPIIFTAEFDDVSDPADLNSGDKGLWGGLIVLGSAVVGVDGGVQNVEGIPSTEGRAEYGGTDNDDDSGILKYVSIRHGGAKLEANNEINGLTLAGVGRGTTIDYVEVFANLDDGIEWFGGVVDVKHAVVSFCGDDSFDYDQSWDGRGQFWVSVQDEISNRAGEWDGSERADLGPKVSPVISNATFVGAGPESLNEDNNDALRIRDDGAVMLYNSILTDFARRAIVIDNDATQDSWQRFVDGELTFTNNVFFMFGNGGTWADIVDTDGGGDQLLIEHLENNGSEIADPGIAGISRQPDGGLDLRINADGAAYNSGVDVPNDPWFESTSFIGAFDSQDNWADNWTALAANGYFGDLVSSIDEPALGKIDEAMRLFPNPFEDQLTIQFELTQGKDMSVFVLDITGRIVAQPIIGQFFGTGVNNVDVNLQDLAPGSYLVTLNDDSTVVARRVVLKN